MKFNKITAALTAALLAVSASGCGSKSKSSSSVKNAEPSSASGEESASASQTTAASASEPVTEATEPVTQHISPIETVTAECAVQYNADTVVQRVDGSNTIKIPLAEFIEEGDKISSFTFVIYSGDGSNIGSYKGGCGITVAEECPAGKEGWYQSPDFTASTQGTYGEIKWDVPQDIRDYISPSGDVMFGYWWGNSSSIRLDAAICTFTRTRELPVDGTKTFEVKKSVSYNDSDNTIKVKTADFLPENAIPEAVTYNISSTGGFRKFTGAFGYSSSAGSYQSPDTAVFTDSSALSLTWFVPAEAKSYYAQDGEIMLGYWWSEQPSAVLESVTVKYSKGDGTAQAYVPPAEVVTEPEDSVSENNFRSAARIASEIKVGWNLGNSLECYGYKSWASEAETAWGNPVTTKQMIQEVKAAGFNAVRIPVTWGEHLNGTDIDPDWLRRVQEVVDYAYDEGMFVILNMHHDDYIWFTPSDSEYEKCREKLMKIWTQIARQFGGYGDRLLFEGMNEPRTVDSDKEWMGGTPQERAVVNKYEKDFVDAVRATGGKNADRTLIVTSYAASAETAAMNDVVIPSGGGNIILSLHYYAPWKFSDGTSTTFGDAEKAELDAKFKEIKTKFIDKGQPVIIGEFGCVAAADNAVRAQYYEYYIQSARANGIKCFVWDNNVFSGEGSFGIFHRLSKTWEEELRDAIVK